MAKPPVLVVAEPTELLDDWVGPVVLALVYLVAACFVVPCLVFAQVDGEAELVAQLVGRKRSSVSVGAGARKHHAEMKDCCSLVDQAAKVPEARAAVMQSTSKSQLMTGADC